MDKRENKEAALLPGEIEKRSFEIITKEIGDRTLDPFEEPVIKRVIHTSADFDYLENMYFSPGAVEKAMEAVKNGTLIVTDTNMAKAGINKKRLASFGGEAVCFMADEDVARRAGKEGTTRAAASMKKAAELKRPCIFAVGNAPTALFALRDLMEEGIVKPQLIIGVPVGFVNVVESKEEIIKAAERAGCPCIAARGRKGGSNVAAAIVNAILYQIDDRR